MTQLEILPMPPEQEDKPLVWPDWPEAAHIVEPGEGAERDFSFVTKGFSGENGEVKTALRARRCKMQQIPGSEFDLKADLVLLAMGFVHPVSRRHAEDLLKLDSAAMSRPM